MVVGALRKMLYSFHERNLFVTFATTTATAAVVTAAVAAAAAYAVE